jgi:SAM-dependent methyltransferase
MPPPGKKHVPEYAEIFNARGRNYHEAMRRFPRAREEEFRNVLDHASLRDGQTVCDYPSGGGYLENFLTHDVDLVLLETSQIFLQCAAEHSRARRLLVHDGKIPMPPQSADRFISLAGLHHVGDKCSLFAEVHRCLKPSGQFIIADAGENSGVARFLNGFVHEHSEEGHEGIFINPATRAELEECGFKVTFMQPIAYPWKFDSIHDMTEYCRLMFGITRATPAEIEKAIRALLGIKNENGIWQMGWKLLFIVAEK